MRAKKIKLKLFSAVKYSILIGVLFAIISGIPNQVYSQSSSQVSITGIPSVLPTPFADDFERSFETGQYQVTFNYVSQLNQPVDFVFDFVVKKDGRTLIDISSEPRAFTPGSYVFINFFEELIFPQSSSEVLGGLPRNIQNQIVQSGMIPEGRYTIEIEARPAAARQITVIPGIANFSVRYPPPPRLVSPSNNANVTLETPIFAWTPAVNVRGRQINYEFLLVEVFDGQTPLQAINSNRAIAQETLLNETTIPYTIEFLPLEPGSRYAWQITVSDVLDEMPFQSDGESEIYTFTYREREEAPVAELEGLQEIELIPNVLKLTNLDQLEEWQIEDVGEFYELNGQATVEFNSSYSREPVQAAAEIQGITIQKSNLQNPVITGGGVDMFVADVSGQLLPESDRIELAMFEYRFGEPLRGTVSYNDPDFGNFEAMGELELTTFGPEGEISVFAENIFTFETNQVSLTSNELRFRLPQQDVIAIADVQFLGQSTHCQVNHINLAQDEWLLGLNCRNSISYDLSGGREMLEYTISQLRGSLAFDRSDQQLDYDVDVNGHIGFDFINTEPCGFRIQSSLSSEESSEHNVIHNSCTVPDPKLNLGFAVLEFSNMEIEHLEYHPNPVEWDFDFSFEASLTFPVFNHWSYQPEDSFRLTNDGIEIPSFSLNENLPQYTHDDLNLVINDLVLEGFEFPWFEWDESDPGDWNLQFSGEASIAETQGLPFCLAGSVFSVDNGQVTSGHLSADLELYTLTECSINLVAGHKVILSALGGSIYSEYGMDADGHYIASSATDLFIEGRYEAGSPLSCADGTEAGQDVTADIAFVNGLIEGEFGIQESSCQIPIALFDATLNEAALNLWGEDGEQQAEIESSATLHLSQNHQVDGSFVYNVMDQQFTKLDFLIDEPFIWDTPSDDPVLSFGINEARFDLDGFHIDGRNELLIGDETIGTTFDEVVKDLKERRITSGQVYFDQSFAMAVSFDDGWGSPSFKAVPLSDDEETVPDAPENGLIMELGAGLGMDSNGIFTSGDARGYISVEDFDFGQIGVEFTDQFSFQLSPFNVGAGRANFYYNNSRIAYLDNSGFHPLISGLAEEIIPEKLPVPSTNIAYIKLRDDEGELLVDFEEPEPGLIELQTKPGTPIELVLPVLDEANPPAVAGVEFQNFVITATPGNFGVDTGSASVAIDDELLSDLQSQIGLPFTLEEIIFGQSEQLTDDGKYLQFFGDLKLFGERISSEANTMLQISSGGLLSGEIQLSDLSAYIPMIGQSEHLQLEVNDVQGALAMSLFDDQGVGYDLDVGSQLRFGVAGNQPRALSSFDLNIQPGSLTMNDFSGLTPDEPVRVDLSRFTMNLNRVNSIPVFSYDREDGWDFVIDLDADFEFNIADENQFTLPMNGLQLGSNGFTIPIQEINDGTLDGKKLPSFELAGFEFQPLALRTLEAVEFNWFTGETPDINPYLDFSLFLPNFEYGDITPSDGFTFSNITIQEGILSGGMSTYEPLGGIQIPLGPPGYDPPEFQINEILGSLGASEVEDELRQRVDLSLAGSIENIPFFEDPDPDCETGIQYSLDIVEGRGFYGTLENLAPCGSVTMGPVTLSAGTGNLHLNYDDEQQEALFDGTLFAELQGPENDVTAQGSIELDLIAGQIRDGQIAIDQPFLMNIPAVGPSFMDFVVNEAEINSQGFLLDAAGHIEAGQSDIFVAFNQLLFSLPDFGIESGNAEISSGFGLQIGFSPFTASVTDADIGQPPADEAVNMVADGTVIVDSDGLHFEGEAGASLRIAGQEMASLHVIFEDEFTHSMSSPAVDRGRAELYSGDDQDNLLAVYDSDGFNFIDALIAQLPDTLGIPSSDIAYAIIKDSDGDPVIDVESNQQGGYTLSTDDEPLSIHFPALEDDIQGEPYVDAYFTLTTDDNYVPNGGEITLISPMSLEPLLDVPVSLDSLAIDDEDNLLTTVISVDLPGAFGDITASAETTIGSSGFEEATIDIGNHTDTFQEGLEPVVQRDIIAQVSGDTANSEFILGLYGAQLSINSPAEFVLSGVAETSLLETDNEHNYPIFYTAGYSEGWQFDVDVPCGHDSASLGLGRFNLDEENPLDISVDDDQFIIEISGHISFEEMLGEELIFSVKDLQIGADNLQSSPQLVFGLGAATAGIEGTREFDFFDGAFEGSFTDAELFIDGRLLGASVARGDLTFLNQGMEFEGLSIDTGGNFNIDGVTGDEVQIIDEYLVLESVGLTWDEEEGVSVASSFSFRLPEPVDKTGNLDVFLGRDGVGGSAYVDVEIPDDSDFNPFDMDEKVIEISSDIHLTLKAILFDVDPRNIRDTHIALAGSVSIFGDEQIYLGESGSVDQNPGISVKYRLGPSNVKYNITGNPSFEFDRDFFTIEINSDVAVSNEDSFEIILSGTVATALMPAVDYVEGNYEGFTIDSSGIADHGNIAPGGFKIVFLNENASLELGTFIRRSGEGVFTESIPSGFGRELSDLHEGDTDRQTEEIEMVRYFCFGPCDDGGSENNGNSDDNSSDNSALELHLGGDAVNSNGTFSGGIEQILLYETPGGKKSFSITNFNLELNEMANLNANLLYESSDAGSRLLAAGYADLRGVSAGVVGGISTVYEGLSFGLFAAVTTDSDLPIIPGVLAVSGFGGGFFYRPQDYQLNAVYELVDNVRGDPPAGIDRTITANSRPADLLNPESGSDLNLRFSMMLFADLAMFNILDGTTFFELTDGYIALDADGVVLGMDSSPALTAGFFLGVGYSEDLNIQVRLQAHAEFDPIIEADGDVQFFAARTGEGPDRTTEWGFIGEIHANILGFFRGYSTIMASNDGFLIDVQLSAGIERSLLTLKGYLRGSLWNLRYEGAELPFGAYGIAGGEIDILSGVLSGEAELGAAFVRREAPAGQIGGGYEMFAYGSYAVSALWGVVSKSGSAWFRITTFPYTKVDAGTGDINFLDNPIAQAQEQANEFRNMIESAMSELAAELGTVTVPGIVMTDEDIAQAGYNYWTAHDLERSLWRYMIYTNEKEHLELFGGSELFGESLPSGFYDYLNYSRDRSIRTDEQLEEKQDEYSWTVAEEELAEKIEFVEQINEQTVNRLKEIETRAIEYEYIADNLRQNITEVMFTSPANVINQPKQDNIGAGNTPDFHVEVDLAVQQSQTSAEFSEALEEMEEQVEAVVDSIEHNIRELENLMGAQYMFKVTGGITPGEFTQVETEVTEVVPSINAVSEHYQRTLEAVDRYYSLLANKYWHRMNIASDIQNRVADWHPQINAMVDEIISDIEQAYVNIVQSAYQEISNATDVWELNQLRGELPEKLQEMDPYILHMAERLRIWNDLKESPNIEGTAYQFDDDEDARALYDSLKVDKVVFDNLRDNVYNLHIGMHTLGLQKYVDHKTEFIIGEFITDHQAYRQNLLDIMEDHTTRIDDFYNLKANMYGSLYSIIDDYVEVRRAAEQQDDTSPIPGLTDVPQLSNFLSDDSEDVELDLLTQFEIRREEILQTLQPPDILDIRASTDRGVHYVGTSQIEWDIKHPIGIAEISALVTEYGSGEEPSGQGNQPMSIGTAEKVYHYSYLQSDQPENALVSGEGENDPEATTRKVDFELRARGMGGITSTRQVTFDVPVGQGGNSTSFSDNILPEITTPPTDIMVDLDSNYNRAHSVIRWMEFDPVTFKISSGDIDVERYWTTDPANIQIRTLVEENTSSIRGYEYSVGSSIGGQDILGTTDLIGRTDRYPDEPGNWTDLIEATTRIINMQPGVTHYVTVEAFNIGDLSIREEVPIAVVYDDTPPTMPQPEFESMSPLGSLSIPPFGQSPVEAEPFVTLPPEYRLSNAVQDNRMSTNVIPSLGTISWEPSEDHLSGVSHYEYLITTSEGHTNNQFIELGFTTEETEIEILSGDSHHDNHTFEFDQYKYVHIRAVNNAGLASDVYTVSGFPPDPNPPTKPVIAGYNGTDHIRIYLKERSYDAESGIIGYRYSIGSTPGGTDIRGWSDDGEIDFEGETEETIHGTAPYLRIPKDDLPEGQEFYVNIKGVNGQGRESSVASAGSIILDSTPPAEPIISLDILSDGNQLQITVDNIHDDVSGVAGVYATVLPDDFPYHLATPSWNNIGNISGVRHDNFSLTVTYDIPEDVSVYDLNVTVRVQNAAGLETSATESVPMPTLPAFNPSTFQGFSF